MLLLFDDEFHNIMYVNEVLNIDLKQILVRIETLMQDMMNKMFHKIGEEYHELMVLIQDIVSYWMIL